MKQGTEYVYVKVSMKLFDEMRGEWSRAVQLKLEEDYKGDIEMISRDVSGLSIRDLAKAL